MMVYLSAEGTPGKELHSIRKRRRLQEAFLHPLRRSALSLHATAFPVSPTRSGRSHAVSGAVTCLPGSSLWATSLCYWEGRKGTVFTLLSSQHEALNRYSVMGWNLGLTATLETAKFDLPIHKTENRGLDRLSGT